MGNEKKLLFNLTQYKAQFVPFDNGKSPDFRTQEKTANTAAAEAREDDIWLELKNHGTRRRPYLALLHELSNLTKRQQAKRKLMPQLNSCFPRQITRTRLLSLVYYLNLVRLWLLYILFINKSFHPGQ